MYIKTKEQVINLSTSCTMQKEDSKLEGFFLNFIYDANSIFFVKFKSMEDRDIVYEYIYNSIDNKSKVDISSYEA